MSETMKKILVAVGLLVVVSLGYALQTHNSGPTLVADPGNANRYYAATPAAGLTFPFLA